METCSLMVKNSFEGADSCTPYGNVSVQNTDDIDTFGWFTNTSGDDQFCMMRFEWQAMDDSYVAPVFKSIDVNATEVEGSRQESPGYSSIMLLYQDTIGAGYDFSYCAVFDCLTKSLIGDGDFVFTASAMMGTSLSDVKAGESNWNPTHTISRNVHIDAYTDISTKFDFLLDFKDRDGLVVTDSFPATILRRVMDESGNYIRYEEEDYGPVASGDIVKLGGNERILVKGMPAWTSYRVEELLSDNPHYSPAGGDSRSGGGQVIEGDISQVVTEVDAVNLYREELALILPGTGGIGSRVFILFGCGFLAFSIVLFLSSRKSCCS